MEFERDGYLDRIGLETTQAQPKRILRAFIGRKPSASRSRTLTFIWGAASPLRRSDCSTSWSNTNVVVIASS